MGLSAIAVTTAVSSPKQRFSPRATLYSPPPSYTSKLRVVEILFSPGSSRSMTSPRLIMSQRHFSFGWIFRIMNSFPSVKPNSKNVLALVLDRIHWLQPRHEDMHQR